MLTSQRCQYALRAIFEVAKRDGEGPIKNAEIARAQAIHRPSNHPERALRGAKAELWVCGYLRPDDYPDRHVVMPAQYWCGLCDRLVFELYPGKGEIPPLSVAIPNLLAIACGKCGGPLVSRKPERKSE